MSILYTFYGDDFTGSTDVLEQFASNGVPAVLFLGPPTPEHLAAFPGVQAIGIAGDSRSRSPEWMSANLPAIFSALKEFSAPVTHYKICSTFDSSPTSGNIGRAIEIGREIFSPAFVPIVVGAPHLRRYVAFGNLFAADFDGTVRRIDRHSMSRHPVTPMREAELRIHLAAQTQTKIGLVDVQVLESGNTSEVVASLIATGHQAILFDTIDQQTQATVGALLWSLAQQAPLFSASSSGLTTALISAWSTLNITIEPAVREFVPAAKPLLAVSGSCSAVTERQIRYALAHDYQGIALDPQALLDPANPARAAALEAATQSLVRGRDTVLYTALGTATVATQGDRLGIALGTLLRDLLGRSMASGTPVRRVLLCGGDTASQAVQQLDLYALTWVAGLQPGAPLCRAHADSELHQLELILKGGQVGTEDFFDVVRGG
jgi:3-oxoisoapionate kinase